MKALGSWVKEGSERRRLGGRNYGKYIFGVKKPPKPWVHGSPSSRVFGGHLEHSGMTTHFCLFCFTRAKLLDGLDFPFLYCANCGKPTGIENLIIDAYIKKLKENEQCREHAT